MGMAQQSTVLMIGEAMMRFSRQMLRINVDGNIRKVWQLMQ
jgi:hypothetical protein